MCNGFGFPECYLAESVDSPKTSSQSFSMSVKTQARTRASGVLLQDFNMLTSCHHFLVSLRIIECES